MPNFKPKTIKKIIVNKKKTVTLDGKHTEIINKLDKDINNLIHNNPMSKEASLLNERIEAEVKRRREFLSMFSSEPLKQKIKI